MIYLHGGPLDGETRIGTSPQPAMLPEQWPRPNAPVQWRVESDRPCFHLYLRCDFPTRYIYQGVAEEVV